MRFLSIATNFFVVISDDNNRVVASMSPSSTGGAHEESPPLKTIQSEVLGCVGTDSVDTVPAPSCDPNIVFFITRSTNLHTVVYR
jgi:hypothetical protein